MSPFTQVPESKGCRFWTFGKSAPLHQQREHMLKIWKIYFLHPDIRKHISKHQIWTLSKSAPLHPDTRKQRELISKKIWYLPPFTQVPESKGVDFENLVKLPPFTSKGVRFWEFCKSTPFTQIPENRGGRFRKFSESAPLHPSTRKQRGWFSKFSKYIPLRKQKLQILKNGKSVPLHTDIRKHRSKHKIFNFW